MTQQELRSALEKRRDQEAIKYRDQDFTQNPNGYTVAPYVNAETTPTAYEAGADSLIPLVIRLAEALEFNCSEWQAVHAAGFKHLSAWQKAKQALAELEQFVSGNHNGSTK